MAISRTVLPISLVVTSYNEASNVATWCSSLLAMSAYPSELVVADSNSNDGTVDLLREALKDAAFQVNILPGKCTISEGRNKAIAAAAFERIAISDFGVVFDERWLHEMYHGLEGHDWIGGCYKFRATNAVQLAFSRLFDEDNLLLDEDKFLPSSRSFGLTKLAVQASGGYDTSLVLGEDTEYVLRLRRANLRYRLVRNALVHWFPRATIYQIYLQNYRYAYWDGVAGQNPGRFTHAAFLLLTTLPAVALWPLSAPAGAAGLLSGLALLYAKTARNTLRSTYKSWARPLDCLVYYVTTTGSVFGYVAGIFKRRGAKA